MDTVGIRDLKTHLSRHLKRVRSGAWLLCRLGPSAGLMVVTRDPDLWDL